jgi:hypothetical protein
MHWTRFVGTGHHSHLSANPPKANRLQLRGEHAFNTARRNCGVEWGPDYFHRASRIGLIWDVALTSVRHWLVERRLLNHLVDEDRKRQ